MRTGVGKGLRGCCGGFGLWIVSCNCPNTIPEEHHGGDLDPDGYSVGPADGSNEVYGRSFAYDGGAWTNDYGVSVSKDVRPELWTGTGGEMQFHVFAAKGPTSYPGAECDKYPPISSATDGGDSSWESDLGVILAVEKYTPTGAEVEHIGIPRGIGWVYRSRAISTDGQQSHVVYCMTGRLPETNATTGVSNAFRSDNPPRPAHWLVGDTIVVNIGDPSSPQSYQTDTLNGNIWDSTNGTHATFMEGQFRFFDPGTVFTSTFDNKQYPCFSMSYGLRYAVFTTYNPTTFSLGGEVGWHVARLKYDDQRSSDAEGNPLEPGVDVFCTYTSGFDHTPDLGKDGTTYDGDYVIMLPSQRCSLDSSLDSDAAPDEPYVCAVHKNFDTTKLICAQWKSKIFRSGQGDEGGSDGYGNGTGVADGTLSGDEVSTAETIVDADAPPIDYPDETFSNLSVWCYNRVWDSVEKKNVNLLLLTTYISDTPSVTDEVTADFEIKDGGSFDPDYLHHGIDTVGLKFATGGGNAGDKWIADADDHQEGSYAARTNEGDVTKEGHVDLSITINVAEDGELTFWYRLDNRKYGSRVDPFGELTDDPEPDNNLGVFVDGKLTPIDIILDRTDGGSATHFDVALIDNVHVPGDFSGTDDAPYLLWRKAKVSLAAGTHTIRWTLTRKWQDNGHLAAWLDKIQFPKLMIGDDIDGLTRWYYDGYALRKLTDWAWAARDEDGATPIASRAKTVPHYITMDGAGRVLIGNPHYTIRRLRDGTLDKTHGNGRGPGFEDDQAGYVKWTASPSYELPLPSCLDPDNSSLDQERDPPPGSMQILPVGEDTYQVRGVNGNLDRDTTIFPFSKELWQYKHPVSGKLNTELFVNAASVTDSIFAQGDWTMRVHSWTVSNAGQDREPHIEVLWRPSMHQPAYPAEPGTSDAERFPHPPYRTDFAESTTTTDWEPSSVRWRDPFQVTDIEVDHGTVVSISSGMEISSSAADDHAFDGCYFVSGLHDGDVLSYDHINHIIAFADSGPSDPAIAPGDGYTIIKARPRWSQSNLIIPRTYSDAWSRIPQGAWVRNTDDPPSDDSDPNWWDPDSSPGDIEAAQDRAGDIHPRGGPWGSARWVLVQARYNPTGFRFFTYEFNVMQANACSGHGGDEEADDDAPPERTPLTSIQGINIPLLAMTDFDAIQCDCGCC